MQEITLTQNLLNQTTTTVLNGVAVELTVRYVGGRYGGWFSDISDASTNPVTEIINSVRMTNFVSILKTTTLLGGYILPIPLTTPFSELKDGNTNPWGVTHVLVFVTEAEYASL